MSRKGNRFCRRRGTMPLILAGRAWGAAAPRSASEELALPADGDDDQSLPESSSSLAASDALLTYAAPSRR